MPCWDPDIAYDYEDFSERAELAAELRKDREMYARPFDVPERDVNPPAADRFARCGTCGESLPVDDLVLVGVDYSCAACSSERVADHPTLQDGS